NTAVRPPEHTTGDRFGRVPKAYVVCLQDSTIQTAPQWRMLAHLPCDEVMTLRTSHSPLMSHPRPPGCHVESSSLRCGLEGGIGGYNTHGRAITARGQG